MSESELEKADSYLVPKATKYAPSSAMASSNGLQIPALPPSLKPIGHQVKVAAEHANRDPGWLILNRNEVTPCIKNFVDGELI